MPADVSASLPDLDLRPDSIVTVTLDDPGAVILSLAIHGWQVIPGVPEPQGDDPLPRFVPIPADESEE